MSHDPDTSPLSSPVNPTVIDLDPDQVTEDTKPTSDQTAKGANAPTAPRSSSSLRLPAFAATLLIGTIAGGWLYRDALSSYFPSDQVKALGERVDMLGKGHEGLASQMQALDRLSTQLKTDVDALETSVGAAASETKSVTDGLAAARDTIASLETAIAETRVTLQDLANRPAAAGGGSTPAALPSDLATRLASLEQDVAALKAQKSGAADTAAISQTLADLKAKIEAGVAFPDEGDRISRLLPAAAGLDVLTGNAAQGLPNAKGLATELAALKPGLPVPETAATPTEESGIWDRMTEAMSSIITIRDAGAINWQQVADKAIAFAEAGDLPQAVAAIDAEEEALPAGLQQWRDRAAARIALEGALAALAQSAGRALAAGQ
ncbi:MAG: hypothetical protein GYA66_15025 [Phyllobacteriaceae bacterium]|nr:hypothetical protein [Phyllobacteriaceae bacterium]